MTAWTLPLLGVAFLGGLVFGFAMALVYVALTFAS